MTQGPHSRTSVHELGILLCHRSLPQCPEIRVGRHRFDVQKGVHMPGHYLLLIPKATLQDRNGFPIVGSRKC